MTHQSEDTVPAVGTVRRVQALVAAGFPQPRLAYWLGMDGPTLAQLMTEAVVPVTTARVMASIYDRVCLADPAKFGVDPANIHRTKERAAQLGWAPVGAWDDDAIDDPAAVPDWTGHCGTARGADLHERHGIRLCPPCEAALYRRRLRLAARELRRSHAA